jgi:hypothetical protein
MAKILEMLFRSFMQTESLLFDFHIQFKFGTLCLKYFLVYARSWTAHGPEKYARF